MKKRIYLQDERYSGMKSVFNEFKTQNYEYR